MPKTYLGATAVVAVDALKPSSARDKALDLAKDLAVRTNMKLKLTYAMSPLRAHLPAVLFSPSGPFEQIGDHVATESQLAAEMELRELAKRLPTTIKVDTSLVFGDPASALSAECLASRAQLIITGAGRESYKHRPEGFSTALKLIAKSSVPVIAVGPKCRKTLSAPRLKMIIADDLSPGCTDAVMTGMDLAYAFGATDILHLHVNTLTPYCLSEAMLHLNLESKSSASEITTSDLADLVKKRLFAGLMARNPERHQLLGARDCSYRCEVRSGDPQDELSLAADAFEADILVFGRHRSLHQRSLIIGKVPHREMLQESRIIVVVPPRD